MRAVRYHPQARSEFLSEVEYFAAISAGLAQRYDKAIHTAERQAAVAPDTWPEYKFRTRRIVDRQFKFSMVYLHNDKEIYVVAVAPMKRKPGYWRARLGDA